MSIPNSETTSGVNPVTPAGSTGPTPSGQTAATTPPSTTIEAAASIHNMNQLRAQAPKVWKAIQQGIAMQIINNMQTRNNELIAEMKQAEEDQSETAA